VAGVVVSADRVSSSSVRTLIAITSGRASVAPTAGIAVPESLAAKPMRNSTSSEISPGRSSGARS
jgi:hypothetical protein